MGGIKGQLQDLFIEKTRLSLSLPNIKCLIAKQIMENEISKLEDKISEISASKNASTVREFLKHLDTSDGKFSQLGLWKLKNLLCPNPTDPPMAKRDSQGNLVTAPNLLKNLYLDTYKERLRNREIKPNLEDLYFF